MGKTYRGLSKKQKKNMFGKKTDRKKNWLYDNSNRQDSDRKQTRSH